MKKSWYAIQTYNGYEHKVKAALERRVAERGEGNSFGAIVVPTGKAIDLVRGKKKSVERRLFPGYILAQIALNDQAWFLVHSTPKVIGFVGEGDTPAVIPDREVQEILQRVEAGVIVPRSKALLEVGEKVKVIDGPFQDFSGTVQAVKTDRSRVSVAITVFGRPTPVELDFCQVEAA